jgi:hypothetical protein
MIAPDTKPAPFAVMGKPVEGTVPAGTEEGLRNVRTEVEVWVVKFVLNWEHPPASPAITSATISHLREYIRTLSSPIYPARRRAGENPVRTIRVLRKPATIECSGAGSTLAPDVYPEPFTPAGVNTKSFK